MKGEDIMEMRAKLRQIGPLYEKHQRLISTVFHIILICVSIWLSYNERLFGMNEFVKEHLLAMQENVFSLLSASTISSTALSALPGDTATPLAENLADIADYLFIVFAGIWLQRYLFLSFTTYFLRFIIPLGIGIRLMANLLTVLGFEEMKLFAMKKLGKSIVSFSLVIILIVPITVFITSQLESTYETHIEQTIAETQEAKTQAEAEFQAQLAQIKDKQANSEAANDNNQNQTIFGQIGEAFNEGIDNVKDFASSAADEITQTFNFNVDKIGEEFKLMFNHLIEAVAMLIVVNVIAPILVFAILIWFAKAMFQVDTSHYITRIIEQPLPIGRMNRHLSAQKKAREFKQFDDDE